jgi:hypothetical protein
MEHKFLKSVIRRSYYLEQGGAKAQTDRLEDAALGELLKDAEEADVNTVGDDRGHEVTD